MPLGLVGGWLHRLITGPHAVLDLTVQRVDDSVARQALFHRLRRAAHDPNVAAVLIRLHAPPGSWAACQDLRSAVRVLQRSGKATYAFLEAPGNALAWIASACDRVFLVPTSEIGLVGVGVEMTFFGAALRRVGIEPDFEAAGAYKAAAEPYTRSFPSPENQEAIRELVDDLHSQLVQGIAEGRRLDLEQVDKLLAEAPVPAERAIEAGLVDQLAYEDQVLAWIEEHHGQRSKRIPFAQWAMRDVALERAEQLGEATTQVVVLHLDGPIVMDDHGPHTLVKARKVTPILKKLREDDNVGAVVLHVNSPGGSALASDLIWREVVALRQVKPVVACFEDVAASGGFYLAAPASEILARPASLTGSIGVVGGKLVMGEGLRKLGVYTQDIKSAPNATLFSASRHFTDDQRRRFRSSLERFYDGFVKRVAEGRRRPEHEVEPHCRGRVWTGAAAVERGLIDRHGDLHDALERARSLAGLPVGAYRRRDLPAHPRSPLSRLVGGALRRFLPGNAAALLDGVLGGSAGALEVLIRHQGEPLMLLPWVFRIR